ncbi:transglutaminase domain-containing protein [Paenibacillus harenae]|uniref:Transglutaminase/protease-like cytokinesis protein 3 n=1 Tax=Paenibacillus harenae TaxID=306543 RepID=A0ABT9U8F3_PAEHA|nr:transglutaminase-like domain-containing protein [Paenibacillus harenae]MDQ0115927.1 transglutaminase/protease-like cytokinesis protein 3 [Paenibacillus harenae]
MRKFILMLVAAFVMIASINVTSAEASESTNWLNTGSLDKGVVSVAYQVNANVKTKVMIVKGDYKYTYNMTAAKKVEQFPLQLGNGDYTVSVLENTEGNKYKVVKKETVNLNLTNSSVVYLNSVQNVAWTNANQAIIKAKELTKNSKTDNEKVKAIYDYIIGNIKYDYDLAANISTDYLPSIDKTLSTKKDICYGYSSLFAAMLRSVGVPTKLVMGDTEYVSVYHAWNEVFLNGKWVIIDTTVDAGLKKSNKKFDLIKDASKYSAAKQY